MAMTASTMVNEVDVKGALVEVSGGGDLYTALSDPTHLYKQVKQGTTLANVVRLWDSWQRLRGTDWVVPELLVKGPNGDPVGFTMFGAYH